MVADFIGTKCQREASQAETHAANERRKQIYERFSHVIFRAIHIVVFVSKLLSFITTQFLHIILGPRPTATPNRWEFGSAFEIRDKISIFSEWSSPQKCAETTKT